MSSSSSSSTLSDSRERSLRSASSSPPPTSPVDCPDLKDNPLAIRIPNLFNSLMSFENKVNPNYDAVRERSDEYITRILGISEKARSKTRKADFAYLTSTWVPDATQEKLYVLQLWQEWAFIFDDLFDEGPYSKDLLAAAEVVVNSLSVLDETYPAVNPDEEPLTYLFWHIWSEFKKDASEDHQLRFKITHKSYMTGLLRQVHANIASAEVSKDFDSYVRYRRATIGVEPPLLMMEWASNLTLPTEVMTHPSIIACCLVAVDITFMDNDILSMQKDLDNDVRHNAVMYLCAQGHTVQQAVDRVSDFLDERYATWYQAVAALPSWGAEIDEQVGKLLELYTRLPVGSLHWSFRSGRYFGDKGQMVRDSRIMYITLPV